MISISIRNTQEQVELDFAALKLAAKTVLEGEGVKKAKVTFAVMDDESIHVLNKRHLKHDEPTDVLTFPCTSHTAAKLEGDVAIGAGVAVVNAAERGHDVAAELCLYFIHGCLHLCGYDDRSEKDTRQMRAREKHYLELLGLPPIA